MSDVEYYQGLLRLVSGTSLFVIMLLTMRLLSRTRRDETPVASGVESWIVADVIQETHNIKSFVLKLSMNRRFPRFKAGQFLTFLINGESRRVRSYSISSSENNRQSLQVSVKLIGGGDGSTWFHSLKIGDSVTAFPPSGHFFDQHPKDMNRVYVAGGIGITPVLSMIQSNIEKAESFKMTLFYGVREAKDLAFHEQFLYWAKRHRGFHYIPVLSHDSGWAGTKGFLTLSLIREHVRQLENTVFFVCGPDPMSDPLVDGLIEAGVQEEFVHNEKFISPTLIDPLSIPERQVSVTWLGHQYTYKGRMNLLEFLEAQGESIPYSCRTGVCGTCKCKIKGPVKTLTKAGLSRHELKEGWTLACVSYPEADVEISLAP